MHAEREAHAGCCPMPLHAGFGTHAEIVAGLAPSPTAVDYTRPKAPGAYGCVQL